MNFLTNLRRRGPAEQEAGDVSAFEREIEAAYSVSTPPLTWESALASARRAEPARARSRGRVRAGLVVAGIAVAAVAIAVPLAPGRGGTGTVSAEELIERGGNAASVGTYHLVVETSVGEGMTMRTETWRDGPGKVRTETVVSDKAKGSSYGQITDGEWAWVYQSFGGEIRAAKFPASLALGFADLSEAPPPVSLTDFIASLGVPGCQAANRAGDASMLGHDVYVIEVVATGQPCGTPEDIKLAGGAFKTLRQEATIWLDKETFMVLRAEYRNLDGGQTTVTEATTYETGMSIPDGTFQYVAPAGVTVVEGTDLFALKQALAGPPNNTSNNGETANDPANAPVPSAEFKPKP